MSLGPLRRSVSALLDESGMARAVRLREPVLNGVPRLTWDRQVGPYRRYVQFAPLAGGAFGLYGLLYGQWIGDENGGHGVDAPDQFDSRGMGDLEYAVAFLRGWLIEQRDWKALPRSTSFMARRPDKLTLRTDAKAFIVYSPFALAHAGRGDDILAAAFSTPGDVARQVNEGRVAVFGTGATGDFDLALEFGGFHPPELATFPFQARLGLEVRDETVCVRALNDLARWDAACPEAQTFPFTDGYYRVTVAYKAPRCGEGEPRLIRLHFEFESERLVLHHTGVPLVG